MGGVLVALLVLATGGVSADTKTPSIANGKPAYRILFGPAPCRAVPGRTIDAARAGRIARAAGVAALPVEAALAQMGRLRCPSVDHSPPLAVRDQLEDIAGRVLADAQAFARRRGPAPRSAAPASRPPLGGAPGAQDRTGAENLEAVLDRWLAAGRRSGSAPSPWTLGSAYLGEGISGLAAIDQDRFLAIHDTKGGAAVPRSDPSGMVGYVSLLHLPRRGGVAGLERVPLRLAEGLGIDRTPSDLEAICALAPVPALRDRGPGTRPARAQRFLAFESGDYRPAGITARAYALAFQTRPDGQAVVTLDGFVTFTGADLSDVEGALCLPTDVVTSHDSDGQRLTVILVQRGGGPERSPARIRMFDFHLGTGPELTLIAERPAREKNLKARSLQAPWTVPAAPDGGDRRHVSAMAGPVNGRVFLVGAEDGGDTGPFASILYSVDSACLTDDAMVCRPERGPRLPLPNVKIEALAISGAGGFRPSPLSSRSFVVASDDEDLGGMAWRLPLDRERRASRPQRR